MDRLEHDPEPIRLTAQRTLEEIEALVARRLDYLYEDAGLQPNSDNPTCPFTREHLKPLTNFSTRKVLDACRAHHQRCIAAGEWVVPDFAAGAGEATVPPAPPAEAGQVQPPLAVPVGEGAAFPAGPVLEQAWNEFQTSRPHAVPDEESALAGLLAWGIEHCAVELASGYRFAAAPDGRMIAVEPHAPPDATAAAPFLVAVCDKGAQGGARAAGPRGDAAGIGAAGGARPLVRLPAGRADGGLQGDRQGDRRRRPARAGGGFRLAGAGRAAGLPRRAGSDPAFDAWQRESRPLSQLAALRKVLALDQLPPPRAAARRLLTYNHCSRMTRTARGARNVAPACAGRWGSDRRRPAVPRPIRLPRPAKTQRLEPRNSLPPPTPPAPRRPPPPADLPSVTGPLLLGVTKGLQPTPVHIEPAELKQHMAFLGAPGSGKTTAALSLIEQLLVRGVPAVMIDRKGDLCRYADPAAWEAPASAADSADGSQADRLRQLRERVDVVVYTPGATNGRPLSIPLVPEGLRDLPSADREQLAGFAAGASAG